MMIKSNKTNQLDYFSILKRCYLEFLIKLTGCSQSIFVDSQGVMLEALLRAGIVFPYACQSGVCGACKCKLVGGEVYLDSFSESALTGHERNQGLILACRARVLSDVIIRAPECDPSSARQNDILDVP
tara:strand:- start:3130 stop:3513 length:384 start_codon:yes stop_codon:yes gene_type:complete